MAAAVGTTIQGRRKASIELAWKMKAAQQATCYTDLLSGSCTPLRDSLRTMLRRQSKGSSIGMIRHKVIVHMIHMPYSAAKHKHNDRLWYPGSPVLAGRPQPLHGSLL